MLAKKTFELNPHHPIMKELLSKVKETDGDLPQDSLDYMELLYNMAMLNSGFVIENPTDVSDPVSRLIKLGFGLAMDAPVEEIEVDISSLDEDEDEDIVEEDDEEGDVEEEDVDDEDKREDL